MGEQKTVRACVRATWSVATRETRVPASDDARNERGACEATEVKETGQTFIRFASARVVRSIAWPECGAMRRECGARVKRA